MHANLSIRTLDSIQAFQREFRHCAATIGKYDGMHLGHQAILRRLREEAAALGLPAVAILSEPQPEEFFNAEEAPPRLASFWDKVEFLRDFGIDAVFRLTFDQDLSQYSPERFIEEILVAGLGVKSLVVGDDFHFGRNRAGNIALLREYGARLGFSVHAVEGFLHKGERVSSTLVRRRLRESDLAGARELLGRDYSIAGEVVRGRQLGRKLGAPTANVALEARKLPFTGIFAVKVLLKDQVFQGVANIGYKPTVTSSRNPSLEVYILDYDGDAYGAWLRVIFLEKLREEEKFADLEEMRVQIARDVERARAYFARTAGAS